MLKRLMRSESGMTLIEIMVVMTILGLISTLVIVNVKSSMDKAKVSKAEIQIKTFEKAVAMFRTDNGFYPPTEQGLKALIEKPTIGREPKRYQRGGYLEGDEIPLDPWGCEYIYHSPGIHGHDCEITSLGADCQEGGEDYDSDVHSWEIR